MSYERYFKHKPVGSAPVCRISREDIDRQKYFADLAEYGERQDRIENRRALLFVLVLILLHVGLVLLTH